MSVESARERLRAALDGPSSFDIEALVQEATEQARQRVLGLLTDAMTEAALDQVCEVVSGAHQTNPQRQVEPQPGVSANPTELGWYVYGVIRAGSSSSPPPSLPAVDSRYPTSTLEHGGLAAVVSRVVLEEFGEEPLRERLSDMDWLERTARVHEQVLDLFGSEHTLIPMRMCTVYRNASGVLEMLGREADALAAALEQLDQKAEWGVKVFADRDAGISAASGARTSDERHGTDYMRSRSQERHEHQQLDARVEQACQEIHARLSTIAVDALVSAPQRPEVSGHAGDMVLNGVYLVHDSDRERFSAVVGMLRSEFGSLALDLVLTGPWPAYNFVPGTIGAAW